MGDANSFWALKGTGTTWPPSSLQGAGPTPPPGADYRELEAHRLGHVTQERLKEVLDQCEQERRERLVERDACRKALDELRVVRDERDALSRIAERIAERARERADAAEKDRLADVERLTSERDAASKSADAASIRAEMAEADVARLTAELAGTRADLDRLAKLALVEAGKPAPVSPTAATVAAGRAHDLAMAEVRARVIVELARSPLPGALLVLSGALVLQSVVWAVVR